MLDLATASQAGSGASSASLESVPVAAKFPDKCEGGAWQGPGEGALMEVTFACGHDGAASIPFSFSGLTGARNRMSLNGHGIEPEGPARVSFGDVLDDSDLACCSFRVPLVELTPALRTPGSIKDERFRCLCRSIRADLRVSSGCDPRPDRGHHLHRQHALPRRADQGAGGRRGCRPCSLSNPARADRERAVDGDVDRGRKAHLGWRGWRIDCIRPDFAATKSCVA